MTDFLFHLTVGACFALAVGYLAWAWVLALDRAAPPRPERRGARGHDGEHDPHQPIIPGNEIERSQGWNFWIGTKFRNRGSDHDKL